MLDKEHKVIAMIGSTKFKEEFYKRLEQLTLQGHVGIPLGIFSQYDSIILSEEMLHILDEVVRKKIDICDEVLVMDVNGYIGDNTRSEIEYAKSKGKVVRFYSNDDHYIDEVGGTHEEGLGWNPNGIFCGECSSESCKLCVYKDCTKETICSKCTNKTGCYNDDMIKG